VPNPAAGGGGLARAPRARGLRYYGNPEHIQFAVDFDRRDRARRRPQAGRYGRTVEAIVKQFRCSESHAKRAIAAIRAYRMDVLADQLPGMVADLVEQWQEIADDAREAGEFTPAVAALREIGKVAGVYAPVKVEHEHDAGPTLQMQLAALIDVLSPAGQAALELVLTEFEAAKAAGRLLLPAPEELASADDDDDENGERIEPPGDRETT
jgi:hypothetical protein